MNSSERIIQVWNQKEIPVILRRGGNGQKLRLRLPFDNQNRKWLRNGRRSHPEWIATKEYWEIPKAWFDDTVNRSLEKYKKVYIIQPYRENEKCAPACMNAVGHECECSCMGENHGAGNDGSWFEVSESFAVRWTEMYLACRLLLSRNPR